MKRLEINGINFDLPDRYEPIKLIGKGTYGAVISAVDNSTKEKGRYWQGLLARPLCWLHNFLSFSGYQEAGEDRRHDRCKAGPQGDQDNEETPA
jgi:hypothetical protein